MYYYPNYSDMGPQKVANSNGNPRIFQGMLWLCMTSIKTCQMLGESGLMGWKKDFAILIIQIRFVEFQCQLAGKK